MYNSSTLLYCTALLLLHAGRLTGAPAGLCSSPRQPAQHMPTSWHPTRCVLPHTLQDHSLSASRWRLTGCASWNGCHACCLLTSRQATNANHMVPIGHQPLLPLLELVPAKIHVPGSPAVLQSTISAVQPMCSSWVLLSADDEPGATAGWRDTIQADNQGAPWWWWWCLWQPHVCFELVLGWFSPFNSHSGSSTQTDRVRPLAD